MTARVVLFCLLALLVTAAVVLVLLWPLIRRQRVRTVVRREVNVQVLRDQLVELDADLAAGTLNQTQYDEARQDISRRLLDDLTADPIAPAAPVDPRHQARNRQLAIGIAVGLPLLAVLGYWQFGAPVGIDRDAAAPSAASTPQAGADEASAASKHALTPDKIEAMIGKLREKLKAQPNDPQGAAMLARALSFIGKFPEAVDAYRQAVPLNPRDADLLADYADALAMTQNKTLGPEPMQLVQQALKIDPANMKGLALAATEAFQRKDYKAAIGYWKRAIPTAQQREPEMAQQFRVNIMEANQLGGGKLIDPADIPGGAPAGAPAAEAAMPPGADGGAAPAAAGAGASVSGRVSLSPALKAKVGSDDLVFIFAKAASGPPMPLAVMRAKAQQLPMDFRLDDSMAMMAGMKLSGFQDLVIGARISHTGNAIPSSGDLQGLVKGVKPGDSGVQIEISDIVP
ncbi:MAG: c-type cytochrome biogenesis protein CcmI [Pseudomonadota bacterium]|nr:c-type cytochrome biogenesis protein CcmI [Pseudomonadota bacterium]